MRKRNIWVGVTVSLLIFTAPANSEDSANTFLKTYDNGDKITKKYLEDILMSNENGMSWMNTVLEGLDKSNDRRVYCTKNSSLNGNDDVAILKHAIESDKELGSYPFGMAFLYAMKRRYPCE